jgi:threonine/homoserine/homoserine lactone efflux protein
LNGFVSGLGAALGDGVFAAVTGLGLTWIAGIIEGYATIIEVIGGGILIWIGYRTFFHAPLSSMAEEDGSDKGGATSLARAMASTFALTITNPATLLFFTSMFAGLGGLVGTGSFNDATFVVAGVVGGSTGWWLVLTTLIGLFHTRIDDRAMRAINRGSGVLLAGFGVAVLGHVIMRFT